MLSSSGCFFFSGPLALCRSEAHARKLNFIVAVWLQLEIAFTSLLHHPLIIMTKGFTHLDGTERQLIATWRKRKMTIPDIAVLLGRDRGTVSRHVHETNTNASQRENRPKLLTKTTQQ